MGHRHVTRLLLLSCAATGMLAFTVQLDDRRQPETVVAAPAGALEHLSGLDESRPNLIDWLERIHARPAYGTALKKGGPYAYA